MHILYRMSPNINNELFHAIKNNNDALVIDWLSKTQNNIKNKLDINWINPDKNKNPHENTLLMQSLKPESVNYKIVDALLQNGADPNIPDNLGKSPLSIAVHSGIPSIVELLLKSGANPNYESKSLGLPLIDALILHNTSNDNIIEIVELLLKSDADVNLTNKNGESFITSFYKMQNNELKTKLSQKKSNLINIHASVQSLDSLLTPGRNPLTNDPKNLRDLIQLIGGKRRRKTNKKRWTGKRKRTGKRMK